MTKLFFDHLLNLDKLEKEIKKVAKTPEEREEIWHLVDEIIHHKALGCVLDHLPKDNHEEFIEMFTKAPHNESMIFDYLKDRISENIEEILARELGVVSSEILSEFQNPDS